MTAILFPPGDQVSATSAVVVACGRASTGSSAALSVNDNDPFIEAPIEFVPGVEAHPSREPQPEPSGSGPFGF